MPRPTFDYRTTSIEGWKKFKKDYPKLAKKLGKTRWIKIIRDLNFSHFLYMIETGNFVRFPYGLNMIGITKFKKKLRFFTDKNGNKHPSLPIDWKRSKEEGKLIHHINYHTDGHIMGLFWNQSNSRFPFNKYYKIDGVRKVNRHLAQYLLSSSDPNKIDKFINDPYKSWLESIKKQYEENINNDS